MAGGALRVNIGTKNLARLYVRVCNPVRIGLNGANRLLFVFVL